MSLINGAVATVRAGLRLGNGNVAQSIAIEGQTLYACQVSIGGERAGHLLITRIDMRTWKRTGVMRLRGAGHGVSISVVGGWLWIECGPVTRVDSSARGGRITRCKFVPGKRLARGALVLDPPGTRCTPSVDLQSGQLAVRTWRIDYGYAWLIYDYPAAKAGKLRQVDGPLWLGIAGTMQGWCFHDGHLYALLDGPGRTATLVDVNVWRATRQQRTVTLPVAGEPEGLAVVNGRLVFGIATGKRGARRLTLATVRGDTA